MNDHLTTKFKELTREGEGEGFAPFHWQVRLLNSFLSSELPDVVDIPTGLGKTSVMALWLIALAEGANLPRRLVYVVDRRAVVDQATRFAERLRTNLRDEVAKRLRLGEYSGLPISTLRGGFADNRDWLEDPSKPAIVVGTVDMVGSRLLFEGYGVSRGMRPYHAGLLGVDALVLLDEAHLCPPFEALLRQVEAHRDGRFGPNADIHPITPPFRLMSLSATGRDVTKESLESVFSLEYQDREEPIVHQRLTASKRLKVTELTDAKMLTECIANRAVELGSDDENPSRVLAYCHSRKDAVLVKKLIDKECERRKRAGELAVSCKSELLVGERRVYERTELENWLEAYGFLGSAQSRPEVPTFLVATSAGEVGVDMDADHMVCDLVAYERMVQRLGRVNRRGGKDRSAMIDVFAVRPKLKVSARKADKEKHEKHVRIFQQRLAPLCRLPRGEDDRQDASTAAIMELKSNHSETAVQATTPAPLHPELSRPLLDAWSMTSLKRHEGRPEVAPWLRGWVDDEEPQTSIVWRKHLPYVRRGTDTLVRSRMAVEFFRAAPIHATEKLEAFSSRVFDWLLKRVIAIGKRDEGHDLGISDEDVIVILINHAGEYVESAKLTDIQQLATPAKHLTKQEQRKRDRLKREWKGRLLPQSTLIVDARVCGLRDGMLDDKSETEVATADADRRWVKGTDGPSAELSRPLIEFRVEEVTRRDNEEGLKHAGEIEEWPHVRTVETHFDATGTALRGLAVFKWAESATDEDSRSILSAPQSLDDHAEEVAERTRRLAEQLKLTNEEIDALTIAARRHDDGKAADRWQTAMNAPQDGRPYAKTSGGANWRLLEGYRHEFGSLLKAEREKLPDGKRDLILHLIAAHHGNARPFIDSAGCEDGPPSSLESKAGEAARRFARLQSNMVLGGLLGAKRFSERQIRVPPASGQGVTENAKMVESTIPVDLLNPGQVFACLGIMEVANILVGDAVAVFDWRSGQEPTFRVRVVDIQPPVERVMRFLGEAEVVTRVPSQSPSLERWKENWGSVPEVDDPGDPFPFPDPNSPATLPVVLRDNAGNEIALDYWGDATRRDNVKFWAGSAGYPGAALARDALGIVRGKTRQYATNPFALSDAQTSSFRFDWRRDYIPVQDGFSPNKHKRSIQMVGFPLVEILAAIGMTHARPSRRTKLEYRYGVLGDGNHGLLDSMFHRVALGADSSPVPGCPFRRFVMHLDYPGREGDARCITQVTEEDIDQ